jgi:hypothetical protein
VRLSHIALPRYEGNQCFIHGLRPALKNFVLSQNAASIEQAMNSARLWDSLYPKGKMQVMSVDTTGAANNNHLEKKVDELVFNTKLGLGKDA